MTQRLVCGQLQWASSCPKPRFSPEGRPSLAKRAGLSFERKVIATIGIGNHGDWFSYTDDNGLGYCQPDLWWRELPQGGKPGRIVVVEVKLTWTPAGGNAMRHLYAPILEHIYHLPVVGVLLCKNLTPASPRGLIHGDLRSALAATAPQTPTICHWPGKFPGAIMPPEGAGPTG